MTFLAVERFSYSPDQIAWLFVLIGGTLIFVQGIVVRRFAAPVGEKNLAMSGILIGAIAFMILSQASNAPLFNFGLILMSAGVALISPCLTAMTSLFSGESQQGFHLGIFRSAGSLGRAMGPLLAGIVYFRYGSSTAYLGGAFLLAIPLVVLAMVPQPDKSTD